jgi:hypothetical protein
MLSFCQWIYKTPLSVSIRESIWVYPSLNVLHCVGILLVAGTIVVVDLRLLGVGLRPPGLIPPPFGGGRFQQDSPSDPKAFTRV